MSKSLNNKSVLVTRPEAQANYLCELIEKQGGSVIRFPVIEIRAKTVSEKFSEKINSIARYDLVIFISKNAVRISFEHYFSNQDIAGNTQVVAIGGSTASLLQAYGITDIIYPEEDADSESLVALAEFQSDQIKNKHVLIVRGEGGRDFLAETLKARGANVDYIEVYQRCVPEYGMNERRKIWQDRIPDAIIVTSNEGLENLVALTTIEDRKSLLKTPLVVMSGRTGELARQHGFVSTIKSAEQKNDEGLLSALIEVIGD